jgi:DNA invertase Pin-like site-specific DNA recombinase
MTRPDHEQVAAGHLRRDAYVYVRQATAQQVFGECRESIRHQYALRERAVALGWPAERIHLIDSDQGKSGASSADREGFERLVGEVGKGRAGMVLVLDASRLTRSISEWHRLLESCALTDTLLFVEDHLYSPGDLSDRLVLGYHGDTSEAALHTAGVRHSGDIREVPA